ncbi:methylmalonyl Co-A mutase-associated GTPase MeaB [Planococcus lenghuensis]|uniref:ATPase/protein kinase n=1 Tax=Planococcus lenghuensis TaxID=2213202 RepID=A0A1Q2KY19_9BACL|nr:methylmalonyl Co-A mutase-associated GTPase MeaB [Planococcus lenghuensis]AQQ53043.1 ATPase/protein kinase [Planococcus lenghuensis]
MQEQNGSRRVMDGVREAHDGMNSRPRRRFRKRAESPLSPDALAREIEAGSRQHLSKAITLIESADPDHQRNGQELLNRLLPKTGNSIRIGITGVPGAGKSTFIETFGTMLTERGHRVAVLAIDPSSTVTGGSILGDKTRMEQLARNPRAFIRPSPTAGTLGGVHKKTRETMLLCEAAGYDVILVETVGVGQSETIVRGMVDLYLLLVLTGAGDELQGMKKGIMELADAIVVHKADGPNEKLAKKTVSEYKQMLKFLQPATPGWVTSAISASSVTGNGIEDIWNLVQRFKETGTASGSFEERRRSQTKDWFHAMIQDELFRRFYAEDRRKSQVKSLEAAILNDELTVSQAIRDLFD